MCDHYSCICRLDPLGRCRERQHRKRKKHQNLRGRWKGGRRMRELTTDGAHRLSPAPSLCVPYGSSILRRFAETYREYVTISRSDVIQRERVAVPAPAKSVGVLVGASSELVSKSYSYTTRINSFR